MTALQTIARRQSSALDEFRGSEEAGLLARLAQTECLLEIAKLSSQRVDLSSYAGMVVGVITQFVPCVSCHLTIDVDDVPAITMTYGTRDDVIAPRYRHVLRTESSDAGELVVTPEIALVGTADFLAEIAEQVSGGLGALVSAERLRRSAAVAQTLRLIDALGDEVSADSLNELVSALALLPDALGARLEVDHAALAGALSVSAGAIPARREQRVAVPGGTFSLAIRWSATGAAREEEAVGEIVDLLTAAFARAEEKRELRDAAETDPLTGIANRRRALRALGEAVSHAEHVDDTVGLVYLDLDQFKRVNDELGHEVGDEVLVLFASHLDAMVRERDTVARFGGEEFVIICPGLGERSGAALVTRIVEMTPAACAPALPVGWRQTTSAGLACYPSVAQHPDALVRAADKALYVAKSTGRDRFTSAASLDGPARGRR
ncbi:MAG TPA: GGDEF domain-containing protein [Acidimicrobiales bacterium]|nr:GGDEF domain-containing protein [Acidimicrobiales bacterium]